MSDYEFTLNNQKVDLSQAKSIRVENESGAVMTRDENGEMKVSLPVIKKVGVTNVAHLKSFERTVIDGVTTIKGVFLDDGHFTCPLSWPQSISPGDAALGSH